MGYLLFFVWWLLGFVAFAWSMEWDIKDSLLLGCFIGIFGLFAWPEAYVVRHAYDN